MSEPDSDLDAYVNQLRNTIHAAHGADFDPREIHERLEGLLFEFRENYEPRIESRADLEEELDAVLRQSYLATDEVIEVLRDRIDDLEAIGSNLEQSSPTDDEE